MEIATLIAFLSPFLPFLLKLSGKAAEKATETAAGKFGEASWAKAQAVWEKLSPKVEAKDSAKEAAVDVANAPEDKDLRVALKVQLKKLLAEDEALVKAIAQILEADGSDGTPGVQIVQTVTGDRNQVIGQVTGGKVIGNITGDVQTLPGQQQEQALLHKIQQKLAPEEQTRLAYLRQQNEREIITEPEHQELLVYIDRIEQQDAERAEALIQLAQIRKVDIKSLMAQYLPVSNAV